MTPEKKQRRPYTAPAIQMAAQSVLNVYAAVTQVQTNQAVANWVNSTNQAATQSNQAFVEFLGRLF